MKLNQTYIYDRTMEPILCYSTRNRQCNPFEGRNGTEAAQPATGKWSLFLYFLLMLLPLLLSL
ncbi:hypothetical protein D770_15670 [Flammeovirgaceae bacterium 311]|nr:hypothetical protein D770_15670 [Flammeovirgaceae bacterium 311]